MDTKTLSMYTKILNDKRTLKCDIKDAIEVINNSDTLSKLDSQSSENILDSLNEVKNYITDKIIAKQYTINNRTKNIIYWSCCNINDFLSVNGYRDFADGKYNTILKITNADRVSFLGKDIIKSLSDINEDDCDNQYILDLKKNYIESEHHIGDKVFYIIRYDKKHHKIACVRNLDLSPRPINPNK